MTTTDLADVRDILLDGRPFCAHRHGATFGPFVWRTAPDRLVPIGGRVAWALEIKRGRKPDLRLQEHRYGQPSDWLTYIHCPSK